MRKHQRSGGGSDLDGFGSALRSSRQKRRDHKTRQLCRQAWRTLTTSMGEFASDPVLAALVVDGVAPAPDASRLLVRVYCQDAAVPTAEIYRRLEEVSGRLRTDLAQAITRKRAPELAFVVVPPVMGGEP